MCRDCDCTVLYVANALLANDLKVVSRTFWVGSQTAFRLISCRMNKVNTCAALVSVLTRSYIRRQRTGR